MKTNVNLEQERECWESPTVEVLSVNDETNGGVNAGSDNLTQS